eukprot:20455-Heterococcus_DN1.PRE.4
MQGQEFDSLVSQTVRECLGYKYKGNSSEQANKNLRVQVLACSPFAQQHHQGLELHSEVLQRRIASSISNRRGGSL